MPTLLDRSPIPAESSLVFVRDESVRVRANQIIAWASLTPRRTDVLAPTARAFPVIIDTGHTHTLSIQERHLMEWAGIAPDHLPFAGTVRHSGRRVTLRRATIWVHPNRPRSRDRATDRPAQGLVADPGIAVYPSGVDFPRLPILGLRAISENKLVLIINGHRREATLRTAYRWWPFAGR
jgi:hypothetical protein